MKMSGPLNNVIEKTLFNVDDTTNRYKMAVVYGKCNIINKTQQKCFFKFLFASV